MNATTSNAVIYEPPPTTAPSSVDVVVTSADAVGSYQVNIGFNNNILAVNAANVHGGTGAGFTGTPTTINMDNNAGIVTINHFQTESAPAGTFAVANLVFTPVSLGTSNLTLTGVTLTDTIGDNLPTNRISLSSDSVTALRVP